MRRETDKFEANAGEGIVKLAREGRLDELKKYAASEVMGCIKNAYTAAFEGAQLGVMKYLWEVCSQEKGMEKALELWKEIFNNYESGKDFIDICKHSFKEDQWDLVIWFFGKLFRQFEGDGGLGLDNETWHITEYLVNIACSKAERSLEYLASFWKELCNVEAYGNTHLASACLESVCARNDLDLLKKFVHKCGIKLAEWVNGGEMRGILPRTPLLFIAFRNQCSTEFAQYLLENGGDLFAVGFDGTLLSVACEVNSLALVKFLFIPREVEITSDWVNFRKPSDIRVDHAFHIACAGPSLELVSFLFEKRGQFSPHPDVLINGFLNACENGNLTVFQFLYKNRDRFINLPVVNLRVDYYGENYTIFHLVARNVSEQGFAMFKYLLQAEYANLDLSLLAELRILLQPGHVWVNREHEYSLVLFFEVLKLLEQENPAEAQIISSLEFMNKDVLDKCMETEFLRSCSSDAKTYELKPNQRKLLKCLLENKLSANAPFKDHWFFMARTFIQAANTLKEPESQRLALYYAAVFADAMLSLNEDDRDVSVLLSVILCRLRDLNKTDEQTELSQDHHSFLKKHPRDLWAIYKDISNNFSEREFRLTSRFFTIECAEYLIKGSLEKTETIKQSGVHSINREGPGIFDGRETAKRGSTDQDKKEPHHEEESENGPQ